MLKVFTEGQVEQYFKKLLQKDIQGEEVISVEEAERTASEAVSYARGKQR